VLLRAVRRPGPVDPLENSCKPPSGEERSSGRRRIEVVLSLVQNLALVVSLAVALEFLSRWVLRRPLLYGLTAGLLSGGVAVIGMLMPMEFSPGVIYDGRSVVLSLVGVFGGPLAATVAAIVAAAYRLYLGGAGALVGIAVIAEAAALGIGFHHLRRRAPAWDHPIRLLLFGFVVSCGMLLLQLAVPGLDFMAMIRAVGPTILIAYPIAFLVAALVFLDGENLRKTEQQLDLAIEGADLGTWDWQVHTDFFELNPRARHLFGFETEALRSPFEVWSRHVHPDDLQPVLDSLSAHLRGDTQRFDVTYRVQHSDDRWVSLQSRGAVTERNAAGEPVRVSGTILDVTSARDTEQRLLESTRRLEAAVRAANVGLWSWDVATDRVFYSREWKAQLGYQEDEISDSFHEWRCRVHPDDLPDALAKIRAYLEGGRDSYEAEFRMRHKNGSYRRIVAQASTFKDENGRVIRVMSSHVDITEHHRTEAALAESEVRYRSLIDHAPEAIFVQIDRKFAFANPAAVRLIGAERSEDIEGRSVFDVVHPDYHQTVRERIHIFNEQKGHLGLSEQVFTDLRGHSIPVEVSAVPLDMGEKSGALVFVRDIRARKEAEAKQQDLEEQLRQSQRLESVGQLAGGVAHDFNNMLGIILGHTELAMGNAEPDSPLYRDLDEIRKAGQRSADLTRQLLTFARKQAVEPEVLDLNLAIEGTLKMLRRLIGENVELSWRPGPGAQMVEIDRAQLDQLLLNLVVNARDAIEDTGNVIISTRSERVAAPDAAVDCPPGRRVVLTVEDDGRGMDEPTRSRIFEPFFTTKAMDLGSGLGLSTVYGILKQAGGTIDVYSEPGRGSRFDLSFPRRTVSASGPLEAASSPPHAGGNESILLVEDEPSILRLTARQLRQLGYDVVSTDSAREALTIARDPERKLDLLLTDVIMPDLGGQDLSRRVREGRPEIRCLFMSGYAPDVIADRGVLEPGVRYIQKPFGIRTLSNLVRATLDEAPAGSESNP